MTDSQAVGSLLIGFILGVICVLVFIAILLKITKD